jgi:arabinofuranan 3-O-arabinosyltransferase
MVTMVGESAASGRHQPTTAARLRTWRPALGRHRATLASLLALTVVSFAQRPGQVTFDTKLDLTVDPWAFLGRALHLWDPQASFGQLQNQAYGYLFPQGPFFAVLHSAGIPGWVSQRLWGAVLLAVAFLGMLKLARALDIGTEPARYVGAFGYALAPRMLTEIGPVSAELLPVVFLPWVLLPLVRADRFGSPRRAAALSGLAVFAMSGVNAAIVVMALPLPGLWLLTRRWTREHVRLVAWWCGSVLLATLWWVIPLVLLGRYSPPFLDYVETAANTTAPLSAFEALRGTNQWVAYVIAGQPWWPAGWTLVDSPILMLATGLIVAIGVAGLTRRSMPERQFLVLAVLTGLVLLTLGHVGPLDSPVSQPVQRLLDGALVPFRNVHKFEPVLRLSLLLGFIHGVGAAWSRTWVRRAEVWVAAALVFVVAAPAWLLILRPGPGWSSIPPYWQQAADWVGAHDGQSRTLLLPAAGFGEYRWGRTVDEPMQPLATSPWAARNQVPLGSVGNTRFLDVVEATLSNGRGSPALADYLARAGVRYLLVRNDLDRSQVDAPPVAMVHAALRSSAGIAQAAVFGPVIEPDDSTPVLDVNSGERPHAIEVYEVQRQPRQVTAVPTRDAVAVSGAPESVLTLLEHGVLGPDQPVVLAGEPGDPPAGSRVVTDGLRRAELNPGRVVDNTSQTMTASEQPRLDRPVLGLDPLAGSAGLTVAQYFGVVAVTASSAQSYADAPGGSDPSHQPFAAVDGDPLSYWRSGGYTGPAGQWLELRLATPLAPATVRIRFVQDSRVAWAATRIRLTTDSGSRDYPVLLGAGAQRFVLPPGPTSTLRVTVLASTAAAPGGDIGIAEIELPGVSASRTLRVPGNGGSVAPSVAAQAPTYSFSRGQQPRAACVGTAGGPHCDPLLERSGEEPLGVDRRFTVAGGTRYAVTATALPRQSGTDRPSAGGRVTVAATSQLASDPLTAPSLVLDGNPDTIWVAGVEDIGPTLRLRWHGLRTIDRIRLTFPPPSVASRPFEVIITAGRALRRTPVPADGVVRFDPVPTEAMDLGFPQSPSQYLAGRVGVADLDVPALRDLLAGSRAAAPQCGSGPTIEIDATGYQTAVAPQPTSQPVPVRLCGDLIDGVRLTPGDHRIRSVPSARYVVQDLVLRPVAGTATAGPAAGTSGAGTSDAGASGAGTVRQRELQVLGWSAVRRQVRVGAGPESYLVIRENANPGWVATLDGRPLRATRVDGWQQAWILPAGGQGTVTVVFEPDGPYRAGLLVGALAALLLVLAAALPPRRRRQVPTARGDAAAWSAGLLIVLVGLLGGLLPLAALAVFVALRRLWWGVLPSAVLAAATVATVIAVAGRLLGHGQGWALGGPAQAATLLAIAALVASALRPPPERPEPPGPRLFLD